MATLLTILGVIITGLMPFVIRWLDLKFEKNAEKKVDGIRLNLKGIQKGFKEHDANIVNASFVTNDRVLLKIKPNLAERNNGGRVIPVEERGQPRRVYRNGSVVGKKTTVRTRPTKSVTGVRGEDILKILGR